MNKNKELAINTAIIVFGRMCTQFLSFLLLPLYTSYLSTEEYGIFDLVITLISLCMPLVFWQIEDAVFRFLVEARNNENKITEIVSTVCKFIMKQIIFATIIYLLAFNFLNPAYRIFLYTNLICSYLATFSLQIARGLGNNVAYSIGSFLSASITIVCNVLFITIMHLHFSGMLLALCVGNIVCFLYVLKSTKAYKYFQWKSVNNSLQKEMLNYSIPMIPNLLAWTIISTSDRLILTAFLGASATGIFSVAHKFPSLFSTIYGLFNLSWTESVTLHLKEPDGNEFVTNVINSMFSFFSACAIGIVALMPFMFPILINANYQEAYSQIPILILGTMFNVIVGLLSVIYIALKKTSQIAKSSVAAAIVNVAVNMLLVKFIGIYAASISTVVAYAVLATYRYIDLKKYAKISFKKGKIFTTVIVASVVCLAYYSSSIIAQAVGVLVAVAYAWISNKEMLKSIMSAIMKKLNRGSK